MTWIFVPGISSPSVPEPALSISVSVWRFRRLARSVSWRGKLMPPRFWWRAWKRVKFIQRLSGLTLEHSKLEDGVDSWIASCRAIRASPTASPESNSAPTMTDGFSTDCWSKSISCGLIVSSARTSRGTQRGNSPLSSRHWRGWVIALRSEYSARRKSARSMNASELSSWPTPRTITGGAESRERKLELGRIDAGGGDLQAATQTWGTPTARDWKDGASTLENVPVNGLLGRQVLTASCSHQVQTIPDGPQSSSDGRRLNPLFVEWLMGFPIGWTGLEPLAMPLSLYRSHTLGLLCRLVSPRESRQVGLFD